MEGISNGVNPGGSKGVLVLIEPDASVRDALVKLLGGEGWSVTSLDKGKDLTGLIENNGVVAVISESMLPDCTSQQILEQCLSEDLPVIFIGHELPLQGAVDLIREGASDYLDKPFPQSRLVSALEGILSSMKG
jgi:DNA-binding NtrC family response regulator